MATEKIEIQGKAYPIKFGYGAFRLLGEKWNCPGMQSVINEIQAAFPQAKKDEEVEITFESGDKVADLVFSAITNADPNLDLPNKDELLNILFLGGKLSIVMDAFQKSMPSQGNPKPGKKPGKKATKKK
ncbi:hypothetical protein [Mesonia aquimarina]|uniref:hypothetical protein n=1 Tax=Mesonia aquimarina TaxID=1504967 RepID=UPI000EF5D7EB|nr:hypothetical protein [Mesonia aquimarina]